MFSVANLVTLGRLILVPFFVIFTLYNEYGWAMLAFVTAGLADSLDGFLARRLHQETSIGAMLDPIADKALITSGFIILTVPSVNDANLIPVWLTVTVISRDVIILLASLCLLLITGKQVFRPTYLSKACTVGQITAVSTFLLFNYLGRESLVLAVLCWVVLALTVSSFIHYVYKTVRWTASTAVPRE